MGNSFFDRANAMGGLALILSLGVVAFVPQARADDASSGTILVVPADLKWAENPTRPGAWQAVVEGDPKTGPSHFFLKYAKNFDGGPHTHSSDHGGSVLSGTVLLTVDGKETRLPAGSFFWIKGGKVHSVRCEAECIQAIDVRGKWDTTPVSKPAPAK
ncbi:MAG: cupin domain-containing protein [Myxococcaceae bacterium]|nr:MAG: cupin domain-containing protein [Myxococcaceae bacterium]